MHTSEVERLLASEGGSPGREWPPRSEAAAWEIVRERRRRYENDAGELWRDRIDLHVPGDAAATAARFRDYTPVPLARDIARFSSQLLFSDAPKLTLKEDIEQQALDAWGEFNRLDEFLADAGNGIAAEGSGALRVIRDDHVSVRFPLIVFEPADRVIWATAHGRYTTGGIVVVEREDEGGVRWRLLEYHGPGVVRRVLYKGGLTRLGNRVGLQAGPLEFRELRDEVATGVDRPTLIPWLNVPGGHSDVAGLDAILDAADDAETIGRKKAWASTPLTFVYRNVADESGYVDLGGAILVEGDDLNPVERPEKMAEVVQGKMEAEDHRVYTDHLRELAVGMAGYSLASWGIGGDGGRADSGRALKLRQMRTILTTSGKIRMARDAISEAAGVALAMMLGRPVEDLKPEIAFGDGFPTDRTEQAEELGALRDSGLVSTRQSLRELHPDWPDDRGEAEMEEIRADASGASRNPLEDILNGGR